MADEFAGIGGGRPLAPPGSIMMTLESALGRPNDRPAPIRRTRRHDRPLRVAILCSERAPGLLHLVDRCPDRGVTYEIVAVVSSEDWFADDARIERRGIPTLGHPIREFYAARGRPLADDLDTRAAYDAETVALLEPFMPDLIVLDGYRYVVTAPLLRTYRDRIISLAFSDLARRRLDGRPRFAGPHAVRDALLAGCFDTRLSVHLVNEQIGDGPPIVRSWPFPTSGMSPALRTTDDATALEAYAESQEDWMIREAAGPLLAAALRLIAAHGVSLDDLAASDARDVSAWLIDQAGCLHAPDAELVPA
jgi:folate-dependent phosphoribosylglycinamide formyltransferase PurN